MKEQKHMTIASADLVRSPWNTHTHEQLDSSNEDIKALAENIKAVGLISPIVVSGPQEDGNYDLIDGHRRLAALHLLGIEDIPCIVVEATDEEMQDMTISANLQRLENDPIAEAKLIDRLRKRGDSVKEIAAKLGKKEDYIYRRARLATLTDKWVRAAYSEKDEFNPTVELLEDIAQYEPETQDAVFDMVADKDGEIGDSDWEIKQKFAQRLHLLAKAPFDTAVCASCPKNTACKRMLFSEFDEINDESRCEDSTCFANKWNATVDQQLEKLKDRGIKVNFKERKYDIPNGYWDMKPKKDKTHTEPWMYLEDGLKHIEWKTPSTSANAATAMTAEEREAAKRVKAAHNKWKKNRAAAYDKVRAALGDVEKRSRYFAAVIENEHFAEWAQGYLERQSGSTGYIYDGFCDEMLKMSDEEIRKDFGIELTDEEVTALTSSDPAIVTKED